MDARLPLLLSNRDEFEVSKIIEEYSIFVDEFFDRNGHLRTSKGQIIDSESQILTDTGLCGALRAMRILAFEFLSKNEKRSRKRRGAKCPRKEHTVLWRTFFRPYIGKDYTLP